MKKIAFIILTAFILFSCSEKNTVLISGKISNPISELIIVKTNYSGQIDTIAINQEDGTFSSEIDLNEEHFAILRHSNYSFPINLIPGASVNLEFDYNDLKKGDNSKIQITGEGSEVSALLLSIINRRNRESIQASLLLPVDSFKMKMIEDEKLFAREIENLKTKKSVSKSVVDKVIFLQRVNWAVKYRYYSLFHYSYVENDTIPIPDSFQAFIDEIPLDDYENYKEINEYRTFVHVQHQNKIKTRLKGKGIKSRTVNYMNLQIDEIISLDVPQDVKDELGKFIIASYSFFADSIREVVNARYAELIKNQEYIERFKETLAKFEKIKPGTVAPAFSYPDLNGNIVSSSDFLGKVIYIDVWSTSCSPCIAEIPHLKELEAELHKEDIAFVSISIDQKEEKWKKMVKEKELSGYQLLAQKGWNSKIMNDYNIKGIPTFIIIDQDGLIVSSKATRPSNPKTREILLELVK